MRAASEIRIVAKGIRSLAWDQDSLVDWAGGGMRYKLTGEVVPSRVRYGYPFDAATSLSGSRYSAIYSRCGTKGLILRDGQVHREINRSYYHADVYEYPIALFRMPSGREVLAHCPEDYCRLEIEDLATGEMLTRSAARKPSDVFHSRLHVSPDGRHLVSAGWLWHPIDSINVYDIGVALEDPAHLDGAGIGLEAYADESCATFYPDGRLAVALKGDIDSEDGAIMRGELRTYLAGDRDVFAACADVGRLGRIAAMGNDHLLALHGHPRLLDVRSGLEVLSWPLLKSGTQTSSILMSEVELPVIAVDSVGQRFAIADAEGVTVVQLQGEAVVPW